MLVSHQHSVSRIGCYHDCYDWLLWLLILWLWWLLLSSLPSLPSIMIVTSDYYYDNDDPIVSMDNTWTKMELVANSQRRLHRWHSAKMRWCRRLWLAQLRFLFVVGKIVALGELGHSMESPYWQGEAHQQLPRDPKSRNSSVTSSTLGINCQEEIGSAFDGKRPHWFFFFFLFSFFPFLLIFFWCRVGWLRSPVPLVPLVSLESTYFSLQQGPTLQVLTRRPMGHTNFVLRLSLGSFSAVIYQLVITDTDTWPAWDWNRWRGTSGKFLHACPHLGRSPITIHLWVLAGKPAQISNRRWLSQ